MERSIRAKFRGDRRRLAAPTFLGTLPPEILDEVVRTLGWFQTTFAPAGRSCREAVERVPSTRAERTEEVRERASIEDMVHVRKDARLEMTNTKPLDSPPHPLRLRPLLRVHERVPVRRRRVPRPARRARASAIAFARAAAGARRHPRHLPPIPRVSPPRAPPPPPPKPPPAPGTPRTPPPSRPGAGSVYSRRSIAPRSRSPPLGSRFSHLGSRFPPPPRSQSRPPRRLLRARSDLRSVARRGETPLVQLAAPRRARRRGERRVGERRHPRPPPRAPPRADASPRPPRAQIDDRALRARGGANDAAE